MDPQERRPGMIIKDTRYLVFKVTEQKPKTKVISVINKSSQRPIAKILWYPEWRQYCFLPNPGTIWNNTCLNEVNSVIDMLMAERRTAKVEEGGRL
jgi:hypothetical protein